MGLFNLNFDFLKPKPKPKEYWAGRDWLSSELARNIPTLTSAKLKDNNYFYVSLADVIPMLSEARRGVPKWVADKWDCDGFAFYTMVMVGIKFGINTVGYCEGNNPDFKDAEGNDRHSWNIIYTTDGFYFYEPQDGSLWPVALSSKYRADEVIFS